MDIYLFICLVQNEFPENANVSQDVYLDHQGINTYQHEDQLWWKPSQ